VLALVVSVERDDIELASDVLWALGVVAVEERVDALTGAVELWTSLGDDAADVVAAVGSRLGGRPYRFEHVDETVADSWRQFAEPTWIDDDVVVVPAWKPAIDAPAPEIAIAIEPGATFGIGDHPTTVLSLRALRAAVSEGARVLDVGCGSGVLAIAVCLFGASSATAIDISPAAVPVTQANAQRNRVADRVVASTTALALIEGPFDVVVANILAPVLIELAPDLVRVLADDGTLIISGILAGRSAHVVDALPPLHAVSSEDLDGWTAIILRR